MLYRVLYCTVPCIDVLRVRAFTRYDKNNISGKKMFFINIQPHIREKLAFPAVLFFKKSEKSSLDILYQHVLSGETLL